MKIFFKRLGVASRRLGVACCDARLPVLLFMKRDYFLFFSWYALLSSLHDESYAAFARTLLASFDKLL